jgi:beta-glucuronidase
MTARPASLRHACLRSAARAANALALVLANGLALVLANALALVLAPALALILATALAAASAARAQGPSYRPTAPTKGALASDGSADRYLLGGSWLYRDDQTDIGVTQGWWRNVAATDGWFPVSVPNAYNTQLTSASMAGYPGWYRRDFTLPAKAFPRYVPATARNWVITFESVNYTATVWLNGHRLGSHTGAYLPFEFALKYLHPGVNRLIVRVDNRRNRGDFPPGPGGQWWNYGGILDAVYLRPVSRADLAQVQIRPLLPCPRCAATVQEQAVVTNLTGSPQNVTLTGAYGRARLRFGSVTIAPHGSWTARASVRIAHPSLWAPGHPALYRASLTLSDQNGRRLGGYAYLSGVRSIKATADGRLELNGRLLNVRGFNLHEQNIASGAALDVGQMRRLINWVRELGGTMIRAHYPVDRELEQMADQDGILVWSEVPVYQSQRTYVNDPGWRQRAEGLVRDNVLANQNHPSIVLWSIGNELPTPPSGGEAVYIAGAAALARRLDPTRPVGMAISNWPGVGCQSAYAPLDVIGDNEYFGWFDAGGGGNDDRDALSAYLDAVRACYPTKALFISEFGFDGDRNGPVEERGTYQFQADTVAYHLGVFATKPWLSGALYFAMQDYIAFPTYSGGDPRANPPVNEKGMIDLNGNHKPSFDVVASIYRATQQIGGV